MTPLEIQTILEKMGYKIDGRVAIKVVDPYQLKINFHEDPFAVVYIRPDTTKVTVAHFISGNGVIDDELKEVQDALKRAKDETKPEKAKAGKAPVADVTGNDKKEVIPESVVVGAMKETKGKIPKNVKEFPCSEGCGNKVTKEQATESFGKNDCVICPECEAIRSGVTVTKPPEVEVVEVVDKSESNKQTAVIPQRLQSTEVNLKEIVTQEAILKYICPNATTKDAYLFMQLCLARKLNPFLSEAYLIEYGGTVKMVVGKDAFTRKAEESGKLDGFQAGIIVQEKGKPDLIERAGMLLLKDETLVGGWAKVYRTDMAHPFESRVSFAEYVKPGKNGKPTTWDTMPATMIRKVALVCALREAFTSELGGCYDSAEMTDKYEQGGE